MIYPVWYVGFVFNCFFVLRTCIKVYLYPEIYLRYNRLGWVNIITVLGTLVSGVLYYTFEIENDTGDLLDT
jgi:hypothetical protein